MLVPQAVPDGLVLMPAGSATAAGDAAAERSTLLNALVASLRREDFDEALRLSTAGNVVTFSLDDVRT